MRERLSAQRERRPTPPAPARGPAPASPFGPPHAAGAEPSLDRLASPVQRRAALPAALARRFEARSGVDLGSVGVTYNSPEPARYGAVAYARGTEIHLAHGQEHNLAHEAWHAVQQAQGRVGARGRVGGAPLNDDPKLEREADRMAAEATFTGPSHASPQAADTPQGSVGDAGHVVQRIIAAPDHGNLPDAVRDDVAARIDEFNAHLDRDADKDTLHQRFRMLDGLDRTIHRHLRDHSDDVTDDQRRALFNVLRETEAEHVDQTQALIAEQHPVWLGDGVREDDPRQTLWKSLVEGTGNIGFAQGASPEFRGRTMAGFAKLLQGAHGAGLVQELNAPQRSSGRRITIGEGAESEAKPLDNDKTQWRDKGKHIPGDGTGSNVTIAPQVARGTPLPPLDMHSIDRRGNAIFSPRFITLGHELGHARHFLRGEGASQVWSNEIEAGPNQARKQGAWTRPEEWVNIRTEENPLRAEHDMAPRRFHRPKHTLDADARRSHAQDRIERLFDAVPKDKRKGVEHWFGDMNEKIHKANAADRDQMQAIEKDIDEYLPEKAVVYTTERQEREEREHREYLATQPQQEQEGGEEEAEEGENPARQARPSSIFSRMTATPGRQAALALGVGALALGGMALYRHAPRFIFNQNKTS